MPESQSPLWANKKVLRAAVGVPLCLLGIVLVFALKPASGATIGGLALLTAFVQALGALGLVLFYSALSDVIRIRSIRGNIAVETLEESALLAAARRLGRHALIDTRPHPEHLEEWIENSTAIVGSSLSDFMEKHRVFPAQFPLVLSEVEEGIRELIGSQNAEDIGFALSRKELLGLVPKISEKLARDPDLEKILEEERLESASTV